ncbi:MAG: DNA helicase [Deltaproteobacteria bacterium]|nr:MAG: DNA helicase [Deltaproteobacteria bacterium]
MFTLNLKPSHQAVRAYFEELRSLSRLDFYAEGAVSPAFAALLRHCAKQARLTLVEQYYLSKNGRSLRVDGALLDTFKLPHGYWEAKDTADDLDKEIKKKFAAGYPKDNILFQAPHRAVIYQHGQEYFNEDISQPERLVEALQVFFSYQPPQFENWQQAVREFQDKLPQLAGRLVNLINQEKETNPAFTRAFEDFAALCRQALNPNLAVAAVEEMIVQHLLTERLFRKVFNDPDFVRKNIIAREIEKVISALTSKHFSREEFLKSLDRFYVAIEAAAAVIDDFSQKQAFLNTVYERFFQGFSVKVADTHGIVYTPQPIVDFMVRSVEELLRREFGRSLADEGVHILDPFVGTGNFLVRLMREIPKTKLEPNYAKELHANEVMLLPYYIASMNLEHCFYELTGTYKPFEGICLVDTFELAEVKQPGLFPKENLQRVERQRKTPIFVILGNPPYNAKQLNENDNNKKRKYFIMDARIKKTYSKDSKATNKIVLYDPFVKAIRWATDRIINNEEGIVAFVTNNSFTDQVAFDGMRKNLSRDFDAIYVLDLGGNVRKNPTLSGTTHNVFGIQVGVSINFFIRKKGSYYKKAKIWYAAVPIDWRKEQKYDFLEKKIDCTNIEWQEILPDKKHTWLTSELQGEFKSFLPLVDSNPKNKKIIFQLCSNGLKTNRDAWAYNFNPNNLNSNIRKIIETYHEHIIRWQDLKEKPDVDDFVLNDDTRISWSEGLKKCLERQTSIPFTENAIRQALYRPFTKLNLYFESHISERRYQMPLIFPKREAENENWLICVNCAERPFNCLMTNNIPDHHLCGGFGTAAQCFPFYTYSEDGSQRRENLTDWALEQYRTHYQDDTLSKWDIFHYIYALLHHPAYREKYAANLKRELPRIPFAPGFHAFAQAGARLAEIHVHYETQPEYPLTRLETPGLPLDWRVEKMKLSPDKGALKYNDFLTLTGLPPEVYGYKLGNRSALEWVIDQYKVHTDKRSGLTSDPNRGGDPQYILRLLGQVITVSLETLKIIHNLPPLE